MQNECYIMIKTDTDGLPIHAIENIKEQLSDITGRKSCRIDHKNYDYFLRITCIGRYAEIEKMRETLQSVLISYGNSVIEVYGNVMQETDDKCYMHEFKYDREQDKPFVLRYEIVEM